MAKYRKKPVVVEAVQWSHPGIPKPAVGKPDKFGVIWQYDAQGRLWRGILGNSPNKEVVYHDYWIVTDVNRGIIYACAPEEFYRTYEKVED